MIPAEIYSIEERRINGVFYTPDFLAEYLVKKVLHYKSSNSIISVLDPACGDSQLLRYFSKEISLKKECESRLKIFGIDKDINAIISSTAKFSDIKPTNIISKFIHADGLFPTDKNESELSWNQLREELNLTKGFDAILSNPPWGADMSEYSTALLNCNFTLARGQFDIYNLFVESIIKNLANDGIYALVLPDSVFSQEQSRFRGFLARNTKIHLIARLGEKIFSEINRACAIIIGSKAQITNEHQVECFRLSSDYKKKILANELFLEDVEKELSHKVPQIRFCENQNFSFDIDLKIEEQNVFNKIQNVGISLSQVVENTRGAEISKKGIACKCPSCEHWLPYPKAVIPKCYHCGNILKLDEIITEKIIINHSGVGNFKLKVGEDLYRFTSISKSWINTLKKGINYKNLSIYQGEKILVRKTGVGVTASIDYDNSITNQVVYILKLRANFVHKLTTEFVLAILNSRAITYYLIKKYGENEWKTHPYLTQTMLIGLPFPQIDFKSKLTQGYIQQITDLIKNEVVDSNAKNISKQTDILIERIVAKLFGLTEKDYEVIFETLNTAEPLIPIKRLLNITSKEIFNINGI